VKASQRVNTSEVAASDDTFFADLLLPCFAPPRDQVSEQGADTAQDDRSADLRQRTDPGALDQEAPDEYVDVMDRSAEDNNVPGKVAAELNQQPEDEDDHAQVNLAPITEEYFIKNNTAFHQHCSNLTSQ